MWFDSIDIFLVESLDCLFDFVRTRQIYSRICVAFIQHIGSVHDSNIFLNMKWIIILCKSNLFYCICYHFSCFIHYYLLLFLAFFPSPGNSISRWDSVCFVCLLGFDWIETKTIIADSYIASMYCTIAVAINLAIVVVTISSKMRIKWRKYADYLVELFCGHIHFFCTSKS